MKRRSAMNPIHSAESIDQERRHSLGAAEIGWTGPAGAQTARPGPLHTAFATLKQIKAGVLNVGYAEAGPADGPPVILLHGWPYDIYTFADVAPRLAAQGYPVLVPYVRGYGTTQFLSA